MAIVVGLSGLCVNVQVNGRRLAEHLDPSLPGTLVLDSGGTYIPKVTRYMDCPGEVNFETVGHVTDDYKWGYGLDRAVGISSKEDGAATVPSTPQQGFNWNH
jgi:hypothetical protein